LCSMRPLPSGSANRAMWQTPVSKVSPMNRTPFASRAALAAATMRMTRATMLEVLRTDYVRTARSKGLSSRSVVWGHALRNARIPIVTLLGIQLGQLLGGVVITETVFSWPGIGKLTVDAIFARDYPVVQGAVLLTATLFVLINLATDLIYTVLDPRVRLS